MLYSLTLLTLTLATRLASSQGLPAPVLDSVTDSVSNPCNGPACWDHKYEDGTPCSFGASCDNCKNPAKFWWSKKAHACGEEPKWIDGTMCSGPSCAACGNSANFWPSLHSEACGTPPTPKLTPTKDTSGTPNTPAPTNRVAPTPRTPRPTPEPESFQTETEPEPELEHPSSPAAKSSDCVARYISTFVFLGYFLNQRMF